MLFLHVEFCNRRSPVKGRRVCEVQKRESEGRDEHVFGSDVDHGPGPRLCVVSLHCNVRQSLPQQSPSGSTILSLRPKTMFNDQRSQRQHHLGRALAVPVEQVKVQCNLSLIHDTPATSMSKSRPLQPPMQEFQ